MKVTTHRVQPRTELRRPATSIQQFHWTETRRAGEEWHRLQAAERTRWLVVPASSQDHAMRHREGKLFAPGSLGNPEPLTSKASRRPGTVANGENKHVLGCIVTLIARGKACRPFPRIAQALCWDGCFRDTEHVATMVPDLGRGARDHGRAGHAKTERTSSTSSRPALSLASRNISYGRLVLKCDLAPTVLRCGKPPQ